jgi:methylated-DNA-protein-cysteine methyltransferase related protein
VPSPAAPPHAAPWPDDHEPTPFQAAVVRAVAELRPGDLATYAEVAEQVGRPGAGQAVANVLRRAPDLPWWRVVPAGGRLYCSHASTQAPLLEAEGHRVDDRRRVLTAAAGTRGSGSSRGRRRRSA